MKPKFKILNLTISELLYVLMMLSIIVLGIIFYKVQNQRARDDQRLRKAEATVIASKTEKDSGLTEDKYHHVRTFEFEHSGQKVTADLIEEQNIRGLGKAVGAESTDSQPVGTRATIYYDPENPKRVKSVPESSLPWWGVVILVIVTIGLAEGVWQYGAAQFRELGGKKSDEQNNVT